MRGSDQKTIIYFAVKRLCDLVFGVILLLVFLPVILVAAVLIAIESPGVPWFCQIRLGKDGRPFRIFKLRGMYADARQRFPELYDYSRKQGLGFYFHNEDDPRVTRVGRVTRRLSIDELPNLINVVLGDMSLVGPRPEIPEVLQLYGKYRDEYLSVKPGITCWSKCTGRDKLTKEQSVHVDLEYVRDQSIAVDLRILWRTFLGVIGRKDVY